MREQLARAQAGPFVRIRQQLAEMQAASSPLGNFQAQMIRWQEVGPFASLQTQLNAARASLKQNDALLEGVRAQIAAALDPLAAALHGIADRALTAYPVALLEQITRTRSLWIPANLRHLRPAMWAWLFRVSAKDGVCLAWAPRRSIVDELLNLQTSQERHQLLLHRRQEVVADVLSSLREIEHPELMTYVEFAAEAAACIQEGRYGAAQAMLGNILDSALRAHGRAWFRHNFGVFSASGDSNHKLVRGVLSRHNGVIIGGLSTMLGPYLLATSLKNAFDGPQKQQSTFNRNLTAHHVTKGTYRNEFALTALLVVQGLLRQLDGYLCSEPALHDGGSEDDESEWTAVLNEAITVFNALNSAVSKETFAKAVEDADPKEYMAKRGNVMSALHGFKNNLPPAPLVYGPAPVCETCGKDAVPGPAAARRGKPGTYWWCETCTARLGDRKPL
ncbi:hypothetical protein BGK72_38990 [Streptomyces agglomeratus]|nr:hypothetical protein BGK72_38990 [Streptomyces agglomeratus]